MLQFIDRNISSVDQLEILLLLRERKDRAWSAREVSDELRNNETSAAERMATMSAMGLLESVERTTYRYAPADSETDRLVALLASSYRDFRLRIIERIFTKPDGLTAFADAFRFRREKN